MKPRVYVAVLVLIIPFQSSLFDALSFSGIKPDLALAILYIIGLLTSPAEAALAGMAIGLVQDIGSAGLIGFTGIIRGLEGLAAGFLGARVLDISSPVMVLFLTAFSLAQGIFISFFLQITYGSVPFLAMMGGRVLPQALYTGILGFFLLRLISRKNVLPALMRRDFQKE